MVFLDRKFTIPNFPTRILGYLLHKMPIIFATDPITDVGRIAEENGCGFWIESGQLDEFNNRVDSLVNNRIAIPDMREKAFRLLKEQYEVSVSYNAIISHFV